MPTCPTCNRYFDSTSVLMGRAMIAAACPHCRGLSTSSSTSRSRTTERKTQDRSDRKSPTMIVRERLAKFASKFGGELVVWIGQDANAGQLVNRQLVAKGLSDGVPEALGGVCYAIVTECFRMLTKSPKTAIKTFRVEMEFIPDRYREIQRIFHSKLEAYLMAARLAEKNTVQAEKWDNLDRFERAATPAIQQFWREQRDESLARAERHLATFRRLKGELYVTQQIVQSGIVYRVILTNQKLTPEKVLAKLKSSGYYMVALQGAKGHAVGCWVRRPIFGSDTYAFIDPNTGLFLFDNKEGFEAFVVAYWKVMLNEFPKGVLIHYK